MNRLLTVTIVVFTSVFLFSCGGKKNTPPSQAMNIEKQKAISHFLNVLAVQENDPSALINLGNIYYDLQRFDSAAFYYENFLRQDTGNVNVCCDLATCYLNTGKLPEAIVLLRKNIKKDPAHPQSHYNLSVMLEKSGDKTGAEKEIKIYNQLVK